MKHSANEIDDQLVLRAISFAARKHDGQFRKDGRTPYIAHPLRVMTILVAKFGVRDADLLAAAVLHDTIEDTSTDRDQISEQFGERVAGFVADLSKDKRLPEADREPIYYDHLAKAPVEVKLCKLADSLDNLIDSAGLPPAERAKSADRARRLVGVFSPGFPPEWQHVLQSVREELATGES